LRHTYRIFTFSEIYAIIQSNQKKGRDAVGQIDLNKLPKNAAADNTVGKKSKLSQVLKIISAVVMLAYIIIPTDLLPDLLPVVGWVDDIAAGVGLIASVVSALKTGRYNPDTRMEQRARDVFGDNNF